jgi:hypothetical protein
MGYLGNVSQTSALVNVTLLSGSAIGLLGNGWPGGGRIQGSLTAFLQPSTGANLDASLAQTGLVSPLSQSLLFYAVPKADAFGIPIGLPDGSFSVSLGGQPLQLINLGTGPNNSISYGADIHAWAGQTAELRFTAFAQLSQQNNLFLDGVQFSPLPVPEPGVIALLAIGGLALCFRRRS